MKDMENIENTSSSNNNISENFFPVLSELPVVKIIDDNKERALIDCNEGIDSHVIENFYLTNEKTAGDFFKILLLMVIFALTVFFMFPARRFFSENLTKNELIISRNLNEMNSQELTTELFRAFFNNLIIEFEGQSTLKISYIKNFIIENNNLLSDNNYRRDWMIVFETLFSALYHNKSYNSIVDNYREYESLLIENKILNDKIEFFYVASRMEIFRNIQHEGIFRELLSKLNELEKSTLDEDYKTHVQIVKAEVYYKLWEIEKFNIQSTNYSESLKLLNIEMLKNNYDALIIKRNVYEKIHDLLSERNPRTGFFTFKYNTININGVSFQRDEIKHELNSINKILKDNF